MLLLIFLKSVKFWKGWFCVNINEFYNMNAKIKKKKYFIISYDNQSIFFLIVGGHGLIKDCVPKKQSSCSFSIKKSRLSTEEKTIVCI